MIRFLLLSLLLLSGCRTIQKAASSSDVAKSDTQSSKYDREIVTEYVVRDTATGKPVIVNVMPSQPGQFMPQDPIVITQKEPYIIRQTIRESGEQQQVKTEQIKEESKEKEAGVPMLLQVAAVAIAFGFLILVLIIAIKQLK